MSADVDISRAFATTETYAPVEAFAASSLELDAGARRLEGAFYGSSGYRALRNMKRAGYQMRGVRDLARVSWFGPFGRTYVIDRDAGVPFLSSSEMLEASPDPQHYLSKVLTPKLNRLIVQEGTILVSCSGTIGNVMLCTADHAEMAVSQHAIRVIPNDRLDRGLLYAFLQSDVGQFLLTRNKSGSVVESLYEDDVGSLPVPLLPKSLRRELTRLLDRSADLRVRANALLCASVNDVQRACYLPDVSGRLMARRTEFLAYETPSSQVFSRLLGPGDVRLDATAYEPLARALRGTILEHPQGRLLGDLVHDIYRVAPGRRTYVEDATHGLPLIGGKQMMQWRAHDVKFLSRALTVRNATQTLQHGTTLVAAGGTIGRTMYVHRNFESAVASEDVMRLVPRPDRVCPGFLYSFMTSPYGQVQLEQRAFGSVIPRLRHFQFHSIAVRLPKDRGEAIHEQVTDAFDARAEGRKLEDEAIDLFAGALERGRGYVESEWGTEY